MSPIQDRTRPETRPVNALPSAIASAARARASGSRPRPRPRSRRAGQAGSGPCRSRLRLHRLGRFRPPLVQIGTRLSPPANRPAPPAPATACSPITARSSSRTQPPTRASCSDGIQLANARACRSYLGVPLLDPANRVIGTLAVLAIEPNRFSPEHVNLIAISRGARQSPASSSTAAWPHKEQAQRLQAAPGARRRHRAQLRRRHPRFHPPPWSPSSTPPAAWFAFNRPCEELTGLSLAGIVGRPFVEEILVEREARNWAMDKAQARRPGPRSPALTKTSGAPPTPSPAASAGPPARSSAPPAKCNTSSSAARMSPASARPELALLSSETRYRHVVENKPRLRLHLYPRGHAHLAEHLHRREPGLRSRRTHWQAAG